MYKQKQNAFCFVFTCAKTLGTYNSKQNFSSAIVFGPHFPKRWFGQNNRQTGIT